jgi:hypothetical protein
MIPKNAEMVREIEQLKGGKEEACASGTGSGTPLAV